MRRCSCLLAALAAVSLGCPSSLPAQSFTLGLAHGSGPCDRIDSESVWFECVLGSAATDPPVDGWALALANCGGGRIAALTVAGTAGEPALTEGFVHNEIVGAGGREGAVSFVALSTANPRTLPPVPAQPLLIVRVEAQLGASPCLELVEGLESSAGIVSNVVQSNSRAFRPTITGSPL